jgi:hypothetical protein
MSHVLILLLALKIVRGGGRGKVRAGFKFGLKKPAGFAGRRAIDAENVVS